MSKRPLLGSYTEQEVYAGSARPRRRRVSDPPTSSTAERGDPASRVRKKRRGPASPSALASDTHPIAALHPHERAQFESWIESASEAPVAGAGSAKKTADGELPMFREGLTSPILPKSQVRSSVLLSKLNLPLSKRKATRKVSGAENESFPVIARSKGPISKEKLLLRQLLDEVNRAANACGDQHQSNQQSGRAGSYTCGSRATKSQSDTIVLIPDSVFFETNSLNGRRVVDLSDWACLCSNPSVVEQIGAKLSRNCIDLRLRGLVGVETLEEMSQLIKRCENVRSLDLSKWKNPSKSALSMLAKRCRQLERLAMVDTELLTDDILAIAVTSFPRLRSLDVSHCYRLTDVVLARIVKSLLAIDSLRVGHCSLLTENNIQELIKSRAPGLRSLSVRGLCKISDKTMKLLFSLHPKELEELDVSDCAKLTDSAFEYLAAIPSYYGNRIAPGYHKMLYLNIAGCARLSSLSCSHIAASCPFLVQINVARCVNFCDKALRALSSLKRLEVVDFSGCPKLSDDGMSGCITSDGLDTTSSPQQKPLKEVRFNGCRGLGFLMINALAQPLNEAFLTVLDISSISDVPTHHLVILVTANPFLREFYCRSQPGMTRAVLARLATRNKCLELLDIRECPNVDDLALYPLAVMTSLLQFKVSGGMSNGGALSAVGLTSLPPNLRHLYLVGFAADQLDDEGCRYLLKLGRFNRLETLELHKCKGVTIVAVDSFLEFCIYLRSINIQDCHEVSNSQLAQALRDDTLRVNTVPSFSIFQPRMPRYERYGVTVIEDSTINFRGLAAVDPEASKSSRVREELLLEDIRRQQAATTIQVQFKARARVQARARLNEEQDRREHCAAVDIQRVAQGFVYRRRYEFIRSRVTRAVIYLQYFWRRKLSQRRVRKATSYWTNQLVLKMFVMWKRVHTEIRAEFELRKASLQATRAVNYWGEKTVNRVFGAWRAVVQKKVFKAKKAISFWRCQSLPRVLEAWLEWALSQRRRRQHLACIFLNVAELHTHNSSRQVANVAKANLKVKLLVIRRWKEFRTEQKRFLLKASISILSGVRDNVDCMSKMKFSTHREIGLSFLQSLLHWSFRQWLQNARNQKVLRDKHRRLVSKMLHRDLDQTWHSWLCFLDKQKARQRAITKFSNSILAKCWFWWKVYHDRIQRIKRASSRVGQRLMQMHVARAVVTWYEFTQEQIDQRQRQRRALAFFLNSALLRTFVAWAKFTIYMISFRKRWKARHANANLHFTFSQWIVFVRTRKQMHVQATRLQAFWRGHLTRRRVEDHYLYLMWATVLIQTAWRGRLARSVMRIVSRKARLREYLRAERERDALEVEETLTRRFDRELEQIISIQRMWRGTAARSLFTELRRARFIMKKQEDAEVQEIIRGQAHQRQLERIQHEKRRNAAATEIQRHIRGYLMRLCFGQKRELLKQSRCAARVQAVYRGRMSRRRTAALRRSFLTRMEVLTRRAVEGQVLRTFGAQTRSTQRPLRVFLSFFGLDPATFLTDVRDVIREVKEDFNTLKQFFEVVRSRVQANIQADTAFDTQMNHSPSKLKSLLKGRASLPVLRKSDTARKFLRDFEQIVSTTAEEKQRADELVRPGDAVRIVLRGHPRCGETAFVLGVKEEIAQVKLDLDGELEFFPLQLPATKVETAKRVLQRVPDLAFNATSIGRSKQISFQWRLELEAYAKSIEDDAKRFNAARVIQCATRVYLARMRVLNELELQGVNAARRQQGLLRVLRTFKLANARIGNILIQLHFIRPSDLPQQGLSDEPLELQKIVNRFQRFLARRKEIHQAFLMLTPERFQGHGSFQGQIMPVPPVRVIDKLVHYPLQWMMRVTRVPMARMLERRGMFEVARVLGGAEFVKTFEERHVDAREYYFEQLSHCPFCPSEGWALVHGVFAKREISTDDSYVRENRLKKIKLKATKKIPHGWGVAHFLNGHFNTHQRNWLGRNSIEAQFKSLQLVKAMKQKERQERLVTQILARQGTLNTLRSMEGARGFANRHAELSRLEERTQSFYARYQAELNFRQREETLLFEEERRLNELIAKERENLVAQGRHLHELQQQVPEAVTDVQMIPSGKTALEFLRVGGQVEVEYDDENWYLCEVLSFDVFEAMTADILYLEDQRRETIKLVEVSVLEEHKQLQSQRPKKPRTVTGITNAAAVKVAIAEIPFRRWRAGKAVEVRWEEPPDNGAPIVQYVIEWRDEVNDEINGRSFVTSNKLDTSKPPTTTTLWPILQHSEKSLRVRVAAVNKKGQGLPSIYKALPTELLTEVSFRTAVPLTPEPPDTSSLEKRETEYMIAEDSISEDLRRELTCTICSFNYPSQLEIYEHIAREHSVPLICPFRSCQQVCASERALRYHIWRATVPKPSCEEEHSEVFMEIFNVSRQYCMRKERRHLGLHQRIDSSDPDGEKKAAIAEEVFLEGKYQAARSVWFAAARSIHERNLKTNTRDQLRLKRNKYVPPLAIHGVDFADPELDIARREAVLSTIRTLQDDLDAFRFETNNQLDRLRHEEKELQDYIALKSKRMKRTQEEWQKQSLKREKIKAQKTLDQVQSSLATLISTSTHRIEEMTLEIDRLTVIERTFVPFTHQVIRLNRLGKTIQTTHSKTQSILASHKIILNNFQDDLRKLLLRAVEEVQGLDAWDAMIEARKRQLQALKDELRRLQVLHIAEVESLRQKRDDGDERFQLTKLRQQQGNVFKRRALAEQALLATTQKQTRGDMMRTKAAVLEAESSDAAAEIVTTVPSLHIANHDLQLHERFVKGKSTDAEYLRDEAVGGTEDEKVGGARALLGIVTSTEQRFNSQPDSAEQSDEGQDDVDVKRDEGEYEIWKRKKKKRNILRDLPHSYVRLECAFHDGRIRGHVRIEFNEGSVYEGPWVEDTSYDKRVDVESFKTQFGPDHWGKFTFHDGTIWQGHDVDNFFSPFTATGSNFQVTTPDGHDYVGDVRAGKYHGFGTLTMTNTFSRGEYVGEWCEGKRQGYGIERFDSGELYEGYWYLDLYHGHGEIVYDDGSRYEGSFKHGKWHGEGVRTLASGDKIFGVFEEGYLNSTGIMEFMDKRHYAGEFRNTRRHGLGSLTFTNGDRYEGPFENDEMHGEGKLITKAVVGEPLVRLGRWERGQRVAWLSRPSTQLATATFIEYFGVIKNVGGEIEMDLLPHKFKTPYAVMVAGMLPNLPDGVDVSDPFVQSIVRMLAKAQNLVVGAEVLEKTAAEHAQAVQVANRVHEEYESIRNNVESCEREMRAQARKVQDLEDELDEKTAKEQEMQVKVENFWKFQDKQQLERKYKQAVEVLNQCDIMDWYKLRTASLDEVYMSLLEAFATLLNFTTNYYLNGKMYRPTKEDIIMLLSSNEENVHLGDKEGLIHRYNVKALYVLPLFDVYSFGDGVRNQMLHSITHVIHHPRLRPNNFRLYQISPAFAAVCTWVRAAFFFAKKAIEICPVVKRTLEQLVVLEHLRTMLEKERDALKVLQSQAEGTRTELEAKKLELDNSEKKQAGLAKIIQDIEALDAAEYAPLEKARIKKLQSYRPPSAGLQPTDHGGSENDDSEEAESDTHGEKEGKEIGAAIVALEAQVNRRQVFEEDHDDGASERERVKKEDVLIRILEDAELTQEFELMKKEVRKVIDRCGGRVAIEEFPARFEEIMLKPMDPMLFGIKKMRTLLLLMQDVCVIVEPAKEDDVETVQFPSESDGEPMAPRQRCFCRLCPGISYESQDELSYHERTKWHYWNLLAKREGRAPTKYTLAATYWSEAYDSSDNSICYFNRMTGEVVKGEPPMEMQANDLVMELLLDEAVHTESADDRKTSEHGDQTVEISGEDPWEEVADETGNVYFYNVRSGEASWTKPAVETSDGTASEFTFTEANG